MERDLYSSRSAKSFWRFRRKTSTAADSIRSHESRAIVSVLRFMSDVTSTLRHPIRPHRPARLMVDAARLEQMANA
eukprot:11168480-Lingulodinium_polyedra.AAC.1